MEKLKQEILAVVGRRLDLGKYRVFFFGSRVAGKGTERSDIDVGVEGPDPVPMMVLSAIQEEIDDIPTLYKIDIVDFRHLTPKFREVALQYVESLQAI